MFNFQDFLIYTGADASQEMKYATIAAGVINYVEKTYGIHLSKAQRSFTVFTEDASTLYLEVTPINSIVSIKQSDVDATFTYYGRALTITSTISDVNIPFVVLADTGYTVVPDDLKLAIYTHIQAMFYAIENHTTSVSKVVNSTGNTTFFRDSAMPVESSIVYDFYSKRQLVLI
jgi:hypothetical protein